MLILLFSIDKLKIESLQQNNQAKMNSRLVSSTCISIKSKTSSKCGSAWHKSRRDLNSSTSKAEAAVNRTNQ